MKSAEKGSRKGFRDEVAFEFSLRRISPYAELGSKFAVKRGEHSKGPELCPCMSCAGTTSHHGAHVRNMKERNSIKLHGGG